ncbi:MAG: hypothetical protein QXW57_02540, partial [Candidatus Micrarchaeaceae archaeon]
SNDVIFYRVAKSIIREIAIPRKALLALASTAIIAPMTAMALIVPHRILQVLVGAAIVLIAYPFILVLLSIINKEFVEDMRRFSSKISFVKPFYDAGLRYIRFLEKLTGKDYSL